LSCLARRVKPQRAQRNAFPWCRGGKWAALS
jgi:hypothetical protein